MILVVYDNSFAGFLTAVFEVYEYKLDDVLIAQNSNYNITIFKREHIVETDRVKASRVWNGLLKYISSEAVTSLYHSWLSEIKNIDHVLFQYIQYVFEKQCSIENDYSHPVVLMVTQTNRKVQREKHCMEAFIRFQLTKDSIYYAVIEPDYNVLPLIINHFEKRYADQQWLIYDAKRNYGIYYNLETVSTIQLSFCENISSGNICLIYDEQEKMYQMLWQRYFNSVDIKARKNMKLHIQHMPKRYWRYLTEKKLL